MMSSDSKNCKMNVRDCSFALSYCCAWKWLRNCFYALDRWNWTLKRGKLHCRQSFTNVAAMLAEQVIKARALLGSQHILKGGSRLVRVQLFFLYSQKTKSNVLENIINTNRFIAFVCGSTYWLSV